jgi:hypothetical protein
VQAAGVSDWGRRAADLDRRIERFNAECSAVREGESGYNACLQRKIECQREQDQMRAELKMLLASGYTLEQCQASAYHSKKAASIPNQEKASMEARKGFDTAPEHKESLDSMTVDGRGSKQDPVIPKNLKRDPVIVKALGNRDAARADMKHIDEELKTLNPKKPNDQVKIANLHDQKQRDARKDQYENQSILAEIAKKK